MKQTLILVVLTLTSAVCFAAEPAVPANPLIDYPGFLKDAGAVEKLRAQHRIDEEAFLRMAAEKDTLILDARSRDKYDLIHVAGARNLPLTDVTAAELARVIPSKDTRILIYCNNNFLDEPVALTSKVARASLNIYTFNTLYSYGYQNVYELGPLKSIRETKLPLEGPRAPAKPSL